MLIQRKRAYGPNGITLDCNRLVEDWASCTNLLLSSRNVISTTSPLPSYAFFPHRRAAAAAAMSIPGNGHLPASTDLPDHSSSASDSEAEADDDYRPISGAATDSDTDTDPDPAPHHRLGSIGNGVSELDLDSGGDDDHCEGAGGEDAVAEEEGLRLGEEAARAFSEDERRRRAPLPAGAAARIVDAMRGVEFPGAPPPWAGSVPEDQWLDRLRSLRAGAGHPH